MRAIERILRGRIIEASREMIFFVDWIDLLLDSGSYIPHVLQVVNSATDAAKYLAS